MFGLMPSSKENVLILYPYAYEERDAVSSMVRELAQMLSGSKTVYVLAATEDVQPRRRSAGAQLRYLGKALRYSLVHMREIDVIITIDVPSGIRLVGALPRVLSGNRIRNVAWVLDLYSMQVSRLQSGLLPRNRVREFWDNMGLRASSCVVVLGQCMAGAVKQAVKKDSVVVPIWKEPLATEENLRTLFAIRDDQFVLMYAGTAGRNHPMSALVEAVGSTDSDEALLLISGRGSEIAKAREKANQAHYVNIRFVEQVEDAQVPALLATADVHVAILDERVTGTCVPSKAYSAMAAGRACLFLGSSSSQAARDIAAANAGAITSTTDIDAIARVVTSYLHNPGLAKTQGKNAQRFMAEQRSPHVSARRWDEALA